MPLDTADSFTSRLFDYLVIGGGTAGLVLAARLTEDPKVTVGVIEAGEWDDNVVEINAPGHVGRLIGNPKYDWCFSSVPQIHANNRSIFMPRGKALGGSSMLNFQTFSRASAGEYDAIEKLGNKGWNWSEFLKYMKKSETLLPVAPVASIQSHVAKIDPAYHGVSGPIVKSYPTWWESFDSLQSPIFDSLEILGVPMSPDEGNGRNIGAVICHTNVDARTATRSYSANAYYQPNSNRPNLIVITGAQVSRVVFDRNAAEDGLLKATGVEFIKDGKKHISKCAREVVLAAGAFQTPQILELSGIGSGKILSKYEITQLVDLPGVGENLQDHVCAPVIHEIDPRIKTLDVMSDPAEQAHQAELYKSREGILSSAPSGVFAFLPIEAFSTEKMVEEWQAGDDTIEGASPGLRKQYDIQKQRFSDSQYAQGELCHIAGFFNGAMGTPNSGSHYSSMLPILLQPLSRGNVHISSTDPLAPPAIDQCFFSHPRDLEVLLAMLKFTLKLYKTGSLKEAVRNCAMPSAKEGESDEQLVEYIRNNCTTVAHPLGTAALLPREDGGVVGTDLKVYGTANLRVVDGSIIPMQLSNHTQATVYAIAEKAADIMKGHQSKF